MAPRPSRMAKVESIATWPSATQVAASSRYPGPSMERLPPDFPSSLRGFANAEGRLLLALATLVLLLNLPGGRWILWPFQFFSTWIHELCHGLAAMAVGGRLERMALYNDGSGLAWTTTSGSRTARALVASAGYLGTATVGAAMLLARREALAGRWGLILLGGLMAGTALLFVRNGFGFVAALVLGAGLVAAGLRLPPTWSGALFTFLAAATCLNALTSIQTLFGSRLIVGGVPTAMSDAHTVAEALWLPSFVWASLWGVVSIVLVVAALRR